jgi:lactoylglutathione lyase
VLAFSAHSLMQQLGKNPQAANAYAPCFEIALCTPDVAAALERALAAGAKPMRALEVMPWGQTIAYVADINGFLVELCTPVA